ncbi:MAG: hypothetical protein ACTSU5_03260 [Promethearchaeota archaeon]
MFVVNPFFTVLVAFLTHSALCIGYIWFDKARVPGEKYDCPVIHAWQALAYAFYAGFALVFFDSAFKVLVLGVYGRGGTVQHLAAIMLTTIVGVEYVAGAVFVAPSRKGLAAFSVMVATFLYSFEYYFPVTLEGDFAYYLLHVFAGFGALAVFWCVEQVFKRVKPGLVPERGLWDASERFKRVFSVKTNLVLLALLATEVLLNQSGYSLFVWR